MTTVIDTHLAVITLTVIFAAASQAAVSLP